MLKFKTFRYGDKPATTDKMAQDYVADLYAKGIEKVTIFAHGDFITITYNEPDKKEENAEQKD